MKNLRTLFEYQKFNPNVALQARINAVTARYATKARKLSDDELYMVSAAGEPYMNEPPSDEADADKRQHSDGNI